MKIKVIEKKSQAEEAKMKRIMRKNQVIITVLAVMIAIAGYLTYAGRVEVADSRDISMEKHK